MKSFPSILSLDKASLILAGCLILCFLPMPYGYYTVVRLVTAIVACCWSSVFYKERNTPLMVVAIAFAFLFQPLFKIIMDRLTWNIIDVALALSFILLVIRRNKSYPIKKFESEKFKDY